ncbi:MAG: CHASE2 domain-containing protein [Gemmatimonadaceae bacterium]|nr:CHASE2 domain-containing protein [Gemmatimonadaceae bacterium]
MMRPILPTRPISPTQSLSRTRARLAALCGATTVAVIAGATAFGWLEAAELRAHDVLARFAGAPRTPARNVSVVLVTEASMRAHGFPLPPAVLDALVDTLVAHGARTIAMDLFRDRIPETGALANAVRAGIVIPAYKLGDASHRDVAPPAGLPPTAHVGFTDVLPDDDDAVRRMLWLTDDSAGTHESLAWASARRFLHGSESAIGASSDGLPVAGRWTFDPFRADDGGYRGADDAGFQYLLPWYRVASDIPSTSVDALLAGSAVDTALRGRMIFIGADAPSLPDFVRLPVAVGTIRPEGTPGVMVHAIGAEEIVALATARVTPLILLPVPLRWLLLIAAGTSGALLAWRQRSLGVSLIIFIVVLASAGEVALTGMRRGVWIPVAALGLAFITSAALTGSVLGAHERRIRATIGRLFARHLSPQLAREIWERRDELRDGNRLKPQRLQATILFADLRGFSGRAEQMDPSQLLDWIGEFTDAMSGAVMAHGGLIDDFAGDGIKADFGVPLLQSGRDDAVRHATQAVRAALTMEAELLRLNTVWAARGLPGTAMSIGIASGLVVAGNIGSADRLKFTVVGDVVNVAARLEAFDGISKDTGARACRILVDGTTASLVGDTLPLTPLGDFRVKGRVHPVAIHAVELIQPEGAYAAS